MRFVTLLLLLLLSLPAFAAADDGGSKVFKEIPGVKEFTGQMIVRPMQVDALAAQGLSIAQVAAKRSAAASRLDQIRIRYEQPTDEHIVILPDGFDENSFSQELMRTGDYQYVEPDWLCYPIVTPNDPNYGSQWHHPKIDSPEGWDLHTGTTNITAAWVDTGVDKTHTDLGNFVSGYNSRDRIPESQGGNVSDVNGHGTNCAGCIGALGNNGVGIAGVCWNVGLMPIRCTNSSGGSAYMSDLTHGATWAAQNGAKTISVSYSGVESSSVQSCGATVRNNGGILIWAAGNDNNNLSWFDHADVVIAGATDQGDNRASFSNYGLAIDVMAPGVSIYTTRRYGGYSSVSGTSFSAPLTNGLCALAWSYSPGSSADDIETYLFDGCDYIGSSSTYGHGRINVYESLLLAGGGPPAPDLDVTIDTDASSYSRGDYIYYDLTITNNGGSSASTNFWINVTLPNSNIYPWNGYLEGPLSTSVNGGASQVWNFSRRIPNGAPIGSYLMNGYIGTNPPTADETDSTPFSVTY